MPRRTSRYALDTFLRQLARTGNFALAADLAGLAKSGLYKRCARDARFNEACEAALAQARRELTSVRPEEALSKVEVPSRRAQPNLTTPGSIHLSTYAGRAQLRRLAPGCLSEAGVTAFLATLAATCNVRLSAEQVGVRSSSIHRRRERDSRFAEAMDQAIAHATFALECDLAGETMRSLEPESWLGGEDEAPLPCAGEGGLAAGEPGEGADQPAIIHPAHSEPVEPQATAGQRRITGQIGFQDALQLLILHRNAFGTPRTKHDRRQAAHDARYGPPKLSEEELRAKLVKSLVALGSRIKSQEGEA